MLHFISTDDEQQDWRVLAYSRPSRERGCGRIQLPMSFSDEEFESCRSDAGLWTGEGVDAEGSSDNVVRIRPVSRQQQAQPPGAAQSSLGLIERVSSIPVAHPAVFELVRSQVGSIEDEGGEFVLGTISLHYDADGSGTLDYQSFIRDIQANHDRR